MTVSWFSRLATLTIGLPNHCKVVVRILCKWGMPNPRKKHKNIRFVLLQTIRPSYFTETGNQSQRSPAANKSWAFWFPSPLPRSNWFEVCVFFVPLALFCSVYLYDKKWWPLRRGSNNHGTRCIKGCQRSSRRKKRRNGPDGWNLKMMGFSIGMEPLPGAQASGEPC